MYGSLIIEANLNNFLLQINNEFFHTFTMTEGFDYDLSCDVM